MRTRHSFAVMSVAVATMAAAQPATPMMQVAEVAWPASGPPLLAASAGGQALEGLAVPLLPVLIPPDVQAGKGYALVAEPLSYTASSRIRGASIAISGSRVIAALPAGATLPAAAAALADGGIGIELGEGRATANMVRYGIAYSLTVECRRPDDRRCASGTEAARLLESALLVGGTRGDPPAEALPSVPPATPLPPASADTSGFQYKPPGDLISGSGQGLASETVHAPGIIFPIAARPAYLNSQVWNVGGQRGPRGSWKDQRNYAYPWRDNFCEARGPRSASPLCPARVGHQGVDIRPATPADHTHQALAVEDGIIHAIGSYSVEVVGRSGNRYRYLHLEMPRLLVKRGDRVTSGQPIGLVSNDFGGTPTPVHLHFEIRQYLPQLGLTFVPPYASLIEAYRRSRPLPVGGQRGEW